MTFQEMCETIERSQILGDLTAEQIYRYSPTGELARIPGWYVRACKVLGLPCPVPTRAEHKLPLYVGDCALEDDMDYVWDGIQWVVLNYN